MYRFIFKKVAQFHLLIYLPVMSKIMNYFSHRKINKHDLKTELFQIAELRTFTQVKKYITKRYKYISDGHKGFPDWNKNLDTFVGENFETI